MSACRYFNNKYSVCVTHGGKDINNKLNQLKNIFALIPIIPMTRVTVKRQWVSCKVNGRQSASLPQPWHRRWHCSLVVVPVRGDPADIDTFNLVQTCQPVRQCMFTSDALACMQTLECPLFLLRLYLPLDSDIYYYLLV